MRLRGENAIDEIRRAVDRRGAAGPQVGNRYRNDFIAAAGIDQALLLLLAHETVEQLARCAHGIISVVVAQALRFVLFRSRRPTTHLPPLARTSGPPSDRTRL